MKHEFADEQLIEAAQAAAENLSYAPKRITLTYLNKFLDALPDVPHCGDCAVDRAKAGVYEQLLDHPYFDGWSEADESVEDYMTARLNEAHAAEQDDWEECTFEDIKSTDIQAIQIYAEGPIIGGVPRSITEAAVNLSNGWIIRNVDDSTYYRIPAPVQHPDPAVQRYIVDHDDHDMLYQSYVSVQSNKADDLYYSPENYLGVAPEQFTNWSEAVVNVVACDE